MTNLITREDALQGLASKLGISPSKYEEAKKRFESMKTYLVNNLRSDTGNSPQVYLQGSFRLGTEIRPYRECRDSDYDIDIVCCLGDRKEHTDAETVKHEVGDCLKSHGTYGDMLDEEGKRCWTLNYSEQNGVGFHMDILPSVAEEDRKIFMESQWHKNAIAATNKDIESESYEWSTSNPKDFASWFFAQNEEAFSSVRDDQKQAIYESYGQSLSFSEAGDVPDIHVKTTLQKAIQILKRHRDIRFSNRPNEKCKPISMVITVLAAKIYSNESNLYKALEKIIQTLSDHAEQIQDTYQFSEALAGSRYHLITRTNNGRWYIENPTNHEENFADRWHEEENEEPNARARAFFNWISWAKKDFIDADEQLDENYYFQLLDLSNDNQLSPSNQAAFRVSHRENPPWPMHLGHSVEVLGKFKESGGWKNFRPGHLLKKDFNLKFLASTSASKPFDVYWQVVNTGKKAELAGQLRGNIVRSDTAGAGGLIFKEENTEYSGTHWIECFIVQNGVCVARSGEFVVRIK